jgi:SNF2 family DNA or RNA helicase
VYDPGDKQKFLKSLNEPYQVYIMNYDALRIIEADLKKVRWFHIIADEAHKIKNRQAKMSKSLKRIKDVRYKTAMSGTFAPNWPHDLWSVLNWLYPKQFGSFWNFYKEYVEYEVVYPQGFHKVTGVKNEAQLRALIEPFFVRHLKKQQCCKHHPEGVTPEIPDKYGEDIWVDLLPVQRKAYDQMNKDLIAWVGEQEDTPLIAPVVIAKLVRLQQFAVGYAEINEFGEVRLSEPSSKLDYVMEILEDNPNKQFVVFSQFTQAINLLGKRMEKEGIPHVLFTGQTPDAVRSDLIEEFQTGKRRVFAGNIKAGGVGIDLFAASTVIFLDRSWQPGENVQAEDRLHRIGQKDAVQVINLMARDTVDIGRNQTLEQKWAAIRKLFGDS